jgi:hypothetical protein
MRNGIYNVPELQCLDFYFLFHWRNQKFFFMSSKTAVGLKKRTASYKSKKTKTVVSTEKSKIGIVSLQYT